MEIRYGVTGKDRKALVTAIAEITGADAIYKGVPTCSYEVNYFTVDKAGTLFFDDSADFSYLITDNEIVLANNDLMDGRYINIYIHILKVEKIKR